MIYMKILFGGTRVFLPTPILNNIHANNSDKYLPCLVRMLDVTKPSLYTGPRITGFGKFQVWIFFFNLNMNSTKILKFPVLKCIKTPIFLIKQTIHLNRIGL